MSKPMKAIEDQRRPADDPAGAEGRERIPVGGVDVEGADADHGRQHEQRHHDEHDVRLRGDPHAAVEQRAERGDQQPRRQVDDAALHGRGGDRGREVDPERLVEDRVDEARGTDPDGRGADGELEHQIPADDEGEQLAEGGVGERVGAAGDRHHRRELGVGERAQSADDGGEHEREHHRGTGLGRGGLAGEDEDPGADHNADPDDHDVEPAKVPLQPRARPLGDRERILDGLARAKDASAARAGSHGRRAYPRPRARGPTPAHQRRNCPRRCARADSGAARHAARRVPAQAPSASRPWGSS